MHKFTVEGVEGERVVLPFSLWMYRRPVDFYQSLSDTAEVDQMLSSAGFEDALKVGLQNQLSKVNNIVVFEN